MEQIMKVDKLVVKIYNNRQEMGQYAAKEAAKYIQQQLQKQDYLNIIFAAAPSQNDFLSALVASEGIEWQRINAFHMDEYVGLAMNAPQRFGIFLDNAIFKKLPFHSVHYLNDGSFSDNNQICINYANLLQKNPIDIVFMGIGENGHIAFNDPHVALFNDPEIVKIVELDKTCRQQQVNDGCFESFDQVPTHAITLTIPTLMSAQRLYCIVPTKLKANAVKETIKGCITEKCPASILRKHNAATLYLDSDSASYIV